MKEKKKSEKEKQKEIILTDDDLQDLLWERKVYVLFHYKDGTVAEFGSEGIEGGWVDDDGNVVLSVLDFGVISCPVCGKCHPAVCTEKKPKDDVSVN